MSALKRAIEEAGRGPVLAVAGLALALGLFSLLCLQRATAFQSVLDAEAAVAEITASLREPLAADLQPLLQSRVRQLAARRELGLEYLEVADAAGIVLAAAGRFERLHLPLLPDAANRGLRRLLYRASSQFGHATVLQDGRPVGSFDYAVDTPAARQARDGAVRWLRAAGIAGLLIGLPLLAAVAWLLRPLLRPAPASDLAARAGAAAREPAAAAAPLPMVRARGRFGSTLDQMDIGLITCGRDGRVRFINRTGAALTGWPADDAEGQLVYSVFHALDEAGAPRLSAAEQCLREGAEVLRQRCRLRTRGGTEVSVDMMAAPLKDDEGQPEGVVMLFADQSERMAEIEDLRRQSRLSQGVIDHLDEGLITSDRAGVLRFANARALQLFGYSREEIDGFTVSKLMPVPFLNTPEVHLHDYIAAPGADGEVRRVLPRVVGWRKDATTFPVELEVQPMNVGSDSGLILIVRDISERLRGENLAQRLGRLLDAAVEEIYIFDAASLKFLEVSRGARRNLGYGEQQLLALGPVEISADLDAERFGAHLAALRSREREQVIYQCRHRRADGSEYPVEVRLSFSPQENPPVFMAIAADISDRMVAESQLKRMALQDPLTGLPNRRVLHERIALAIQQAQPRGTRLALLYLDLDRFKQVNDSLGHEAGDQLLRAAGLRLQAAVRTSDTVARLGGDEFAILAAEINGAEGAAQVAQKVLSAFGEGLRVEGSAQGITPSIGLALYPEHGLDAETLLRNADAAMYQAKQAGRACYRVFGAS